MCIPFPPEEERARKKKKKRDRDKRRETAEREREKSHPSHARLPEQQQRRALGPFPDLAGKPGKLVQIPEGQVKALCTTAWASCESAPSGVRI